MIIEKLNSLCIENGISLTALCKEITGSSGNLPTWKKNNIKPEWLRKICLKFNISSDYLLDLSDDKSSHPNNPYTQEERDMLIRFSRLNNDYKIKAQAYMIDLYEKQMDSLSYMEKTADWMDDLDDEKMTLKEAK